MAASKNEYGLCSAHIGRLDSIDVFDINVFLSYLHKMFSLKIIFRLIGRMASKRPERHFTVYLSVWLHTPSARLHLADY